MHLLVYNFILGVSVHIRCNGRAALYADGSKEFDFADILIRNIIPKATRVVAAQGYNNGSDAFIIASFSNRFKTDTERWKCTDQLHSGWKTVDYDDRHRIPASDMQRDNTDATDFVTDAKAIWTEEVAEYGYVYCRGYIGERNT